MEELVKAIEKGDLKEVIQLHQNGANFLENKALIVASRRGRDDIVKYLVQNKADVNSVHDLETPLSVASRYGRFDIVKYLIEQGAHINGTITRNGHRRIKSFQPLASACMYDHLNIVKYLVEHGSELVSDISYNDILYYKIDILDYLLSKGVHPKNITETIFMKYYYPIIPENVIRLYTLHTKEVNIRLLSGITDEDISSIEEKLKLVDNAISLISNISGLKNIIMEYLV